MTSTEKKKNPTNKSSDVLIERKNRFAKTSRPEASPIEKPFFRLTSTPDPSTIRPINILEQAFTYVMNKYEKTNDWNYLSSQLKSIRQDLMVQSLRNDFTLKVYEENARLALKMNDREQFVQCQSQIEMLYDEGRNRIHYEEFLLYRFLYSLLIHDNQQSNRIFVDLNALKTSDEIRRVEKFASAFRRKDFSYFFNFYQSLPYLCEFVVNIFIDIIRKETLNIFIWSFSPNISLDFLTKFLSFSSEDFCLRHLKSLGIVFTNDLTMIDCKTSRVSFVKS